jgi:hypothetical protein
MEFVAIEFHYQLESTVALLANEFQFQWDAYDQNLLDAKVCYISPSAQTVEVKEDLVGFQIAADDIVAEDKRPDLLKSDVQENLQNEAGAGKEFVPLAVDYQVDGNEKDVEEEAEVEVDLVTLEDKEEELDAAGATKEEDGILEDLAETAQEVEEDKLKAPADNVEVEGGDFDSSGATTEEGDILEDLAETAQEVEEDQLQAPAENNAEEEEEFDTAGATTGEDRLKAPAENDEEATEASLTNVCESTEETKEEMELKDPSKPMLRVFLPDLGSHPTFFGLVSTTRESVTLYDGKLRQLKRKIESFDGESLAYQAEVSSIKENVEEENFSTDAEETAAVENEPKRKGLMGQLVNVSTGAFFSAITSFLFSILFR